MATWCALKFEIEACCVGIKIRVLHIIALGFKPQCEVVGKAKFEADTPEWIIAIIGLCCTANDRISAPPELTAFYKNPEW